MSSSDEQDFNDSEQNYSSHSDSDDQQEFSNADDSGSDIGVCDAEYELDSDGNPILDSKPAKKSGKKEEDPED